ncbi:MAG: S1 RNA-binding domain-containing protein [bacterium]
MDNDVTQKDLDIASESVIEKNDSQDALLNESQVLPNEDDLQSNLESLEVEENDSNESTEEIDVTEKSGSQEQVQITEPVQSTVEMESAKPVFSFLDESEIEKKPDERTEISKEQKIEIPEEITTEKEPAVSHEQAEEMPEVSSSVTDESAIPEPADVETSQTNDNKIEDEETEPAITEEPAIAQTEVTDLTNDEEEKKESEKEAIRSARQKYFDLIFSELKSKIGKRETVEVEVKARIRGGLRVHYKDIPLFLPTSHLILKKNPSEEYIQSFVGQKIDVFVHEFQEFDQGRKAVIVSRKKLLVKEMWEKIQVGDVVEGKVSSIVPFGVFVDFDGLEGLIHVSQLSKTHVVNPKDRFKKGQEIKARIIEIFKDRRKIGLSSKEFEESVWKGIEQEFQAGMKVSGIVKRLTEFGAYLELKPGIDGLLRNNELSWTKRGLRAVDLFDIGQTVEVEIITISEQKENATLSYKRIFPNPWPELIEKLKVGSEHEGTVLQIIPQGAVISLMKDIDGFMPRSKMKMFMKGNRIPFKSGDKLIVTVADLNPENQSLILMPKEVLKEPEPKPAQEKRQQSKPKTSNESTFSLGDMLSESERKKLEDINS